MKNKDSWFLIRRLKNSDLRSYEEIYKRYYSKLYGFSKKFDSTTLEADDFVQQTFLKLWEERKQLREDVLLDKQIFVICKHLIINHLSREQKMVSNQDYRISTDYHTSSPTEDTSKEQLKRLITSIQKLPTKRKEIFILHKMENLTYKEISKYLNISRKTIANQLYLASDFLKKEIKRKNS